MSIDTFLHRYGAMAVAQPDRSPADKVLAEIAAQAVRSADAEKLLRTVDFSIKQDRTSLRIRLDDGADDASPAAVAARRLGNIGVLSHVNVVRDQSALFAKVTRRCSDEVRVQVTGLMRNGRWLEVGAAELVADLAASAGLEVQVASQLRVALANGCSREIDVLACFGDDALLIECKAGPRGCDEVGRFAELADSLGIPADRAVLLAPHLAADAAADLMAFHSITVIGREQAADFIAEVVHQWKERSHSGCPTILAVPAAVGAVEQVQPAVPLRVVDHAEIEAAIIAEVKIASAPLSVGALVPAVRDRLGCARRPVNDVARDMLARLMFVGEDGSPIANFAAPVLATAVGGDDREDPAEIQLEQRESVPSESVGFLRRVLAKR